MPTIHRRVFLQRALATSLAFAGLHRAFAAEAIFGASPAGTEFPPLVPDPNGILDLPEGLSYQILSQTGDEMSDGLLVPTSHDGMAAFAGPKGTILLLRNHELDHGDFGPFGPGDQRLSLVSPSALYDYGQGVTPGHGGVTTVAYDPRTEAVLSQHLSLAGTLRNCSGGPTPWGTWLSCEETVQAASGTFEREHGYVFEVPASATPGICPPRPLFGLGRFVHEAAAIDPATGIVYMTEDRGDSLLYRFVPNVPNVPGRLASGGQLQALVVTAQPQMLMANHVPGSQIPELTQFTVSWVNLSNVQSPNDDLRYQGAALGAAIFSRGEGMWRGADGIYFTCTNGGLAGKGQIWKLMPSTQPGQPDVIELFLEPNNGTVIENADNLTVTPSGNLLACEDGPGDQRLLMITPSGEVHPFARNALPYGGGYSELAGACFSPCGSFLFLNIRKPGMTLVIKGDW